MENTAEQGARGKEKGCNLLMRPGRLSLILDSSQTVVRYVECPVLYGTMDFSVAGNVSAATNQGRMCPARAGIVKDVQLSVKTAPTGQALIVDVNTYDGATQTSMFSTRPEIAAAAYYGNAKPDTTDARRCLKAQSSATLAAGGLLTIDVDQVGSGTVGADLGVEIRVLQYAPPIERFQTS